MMKEREIQAMPGLAMLLALLAAMGVTFALFCISVSASRPNVVAIVLEVLAGIAEVICLCGLIIVNPNEGKAAQFFGTYVGTLRQQGFYWANPFWTCRRVSLRVRNFDCEKLKVNDHDGNPIQIAAVVVWKVVDTAEALFHVDNYENFVSVQSEAALRNLATRYPYDSHEEGKLSLRGSTSEIAEHLRGEIQERLAQAGVQVLEARISHLSYAPEIAEAMLRRQQAAAIVAARFKIVEGAVGMVELALERLSKDKVVELDEERKAQMVSNMLVVLCGDHAAQPVINTGTIYQ